MTGFFCAISWLKRATSAVSAPTVTCLSFEAESLDQLRVLLLVRRIAAEEHAARASGDANTFS